MILLSQTSSKFAPKRNKLQVRYHTTHPHCVVHNVKTITLFKANFNKIYSKML